MKKEINYLSLFNGISTARYCMEELGFNIGKGYVSEVDKFASAVGRFHFPDEIELGDVTKWREWNIDWSSINLLVAGFSCTDWSIAGKQLGDKGNTGKLMWDMIAIRDHLLKHNPSAKFMFENVKMKKSFQAYVNEAIGVEGVFINSRVFSAQNRPRMYWTNFDINPLPEESDLTIKDILEDEDVVGLGAAVRGRYGKDRKITQRLELNGTEKANCLTTVQKDSMVASKFYLSETAIEYMNRLRNGKPRWEHHKNPINGKAACLTASGAKGVPYQVLAETEYRAARRFTPIECERLQTLPDNFTLKGRYGDKIKTTSNTQRYLQLGNGWTAEVIKHIFKSINFEHGTTY